MSLLKSWVDSANNDQTDFPLNNLPYGVFSVADGNQRCGVAIGEMILDVSSAESAGFLGSVEPLFDVPHWNKFMASGQQNWARFRDELTAILAQGSPWRDKLETHLVAQADVRMHLPIKVAEYTDFYASRHHAANVGTMFRSVENALTPNWLHMPIGYNGRASSVVVSGTDIRRPWGQLMDRKKNTPRFAPSERFDIELEIGAIVGTASCGPVSVVRADENIFGFVLLNDWSARDIQAWEYQPLGPFQAKATATTISPWIVTRAALEAFRVSTPKREFQLLDYLTEPGPMLFDIDLEITLTPKDKSGTIISRTNYSEMYYSAPQLLVHHASCGCPMNVGDLLGSGTISGADKNQRGSLLELCWGGEEPLSLDNGETRCFLEDGDTVKLSGAAKGDKYRIGFGDCNGTVLPALSDPFKKLE